MNKKLNTIAFLAVSSIVQLVIVAAIGVVLFLVYAWIFGRWVTGANNFLALVVLLFAALFVGNKISRRLMLWYQTKVDFDVLFEPWAKLPTKGSRQAPRP